MWTIGAKKPTISRSRVRGQTYRYKSYQVGVDALNKEIFKTLRKTTWFKFKVKANFSHKWNPLFDSIIYLLFASWITHVLTTMWMHSILCAKFRFLWKVCFKNLIKMYVYLQFSPSNLEFHYLYSSLKYLEHACQWCR